MMTNEFTVRVRTLTDDDNKSVCAFDVCPMQSRQGEHRAHLSLSNDSGTFHLGKVCFVGLQAALRQRDEKLTHRHNRAKAEYQ